MSFLLETVRHYVTKGSEDPAKRKEEFGERLEKNSNTRDKEYAAFGLLPGSCSARAAACAVLTAACVQAHLHQRGLQAHNDVRRPQGPPHGACCPAASARCGCPSNQAAVCCRSIPHRAAKPHEHAEPTPAHTHPRSPAHTHLAPAQYEHWIQLLGHQPNKRRNPPQ
jgi:hypothetical protein